MGTKRGADMGAITTLASHEPAHAQMWPSPTLHETLPAKHHAIPAREGSIKGENMGMGGTEGWR